tara:strand:+ start:446 stop:622 length:177 start_codon:yes stop_codon:yes gene_type:complete
MIVAMRLITRLPSNLFIVAYANATSVVKECVNNFNAQRGYFKATLWLLGLAKWDIMIT